MINCYEFRSTAQSQVSSVEAKVYFKAAKLLVYKAFEKESQKSGSHSANTDSQGLAMFFGHIICVGVCMKLLQSLNSYFLKPFTFHIMKKQNQNQTLEDTIIRMKHHIKHGQVESHTLFFRFLFFFPLFIYFPFNL